MVHLASARSLPQRCLGRVRRRFGADRIIATATVYMTLTLLVLARVRSPAVIIVTLIAAGFAWTSTKWRP